MIQAAIEIDLEEAKKARVASYAISVVYGFFSILLLATATIVLQVRNLSVHPSLREMM